MALITMIPYLIIEIALQGDVPNWLNYLLCAFPPYCLYYSLFRLSFLQFVYTDVPLLKIFSFSDGIGTIMVIVLIECVILLLLIIYMDFLSEQVRYYIKMKLHKEQKYEELHHLVNSDEEVLSESGRLDDLSPKNFVILLKHIWKIFSGSPATCTFIFFYLIFVTFIQYFY